MGKRSSFERVEKDFYRTWDKRAVQKLYPFLRKGQTFAEPFAGDGVLTDQLTDIGLTCVLETDIDPKNERITKLDVFDLSIHDLRECDFIISNPPWTRTLLHPIIEHLSNLKPTWLLFDADWMHTKQSKELLAKYCTDIVSVGRLKWIEGSNVSGKDNCAWYRFSNQKTGSTIFHNI